MLTAYRAADRVWSCSEQGASAKSRGTGLAGHFLRKLKGKQGRNRCFPGRDAYFLVENRGELNSILQDFISLYYPPSLSLKVSPLQARRAEEQTLSLFPLSVLPPLSLLRREATQDSPSTLPSPAQCAAATFHLCFSLASNSVPSQFSFLRAIEPAARGICQQKEKVKTGIEGQGSDKITMPT